MKKWEEVELSELFGCDGYRFVERLSNGQFLGVYFQLMDHDLYNCAICIMDREIDCEDWCAGGTSNHKINNGRCGLEGLSKALKLVKWFIDNRLPEDFRLQIHGVGKRGRAYKFVTRIGFEIIRSTMEDSLYVFKKRKKIECSNQF